MFPRIAGGRHCGMAGGERRSRTTLRLCGGPLARRAAGRQGFSDRLAVGCLRKQPTGGEENRRLAVLEKVLEKVPNQPSIALSYFPFAVTSRRSRDVRINQRIRFSSVSRPFRNVSGAASPLHSGSLLRATPKFHGRGFYQTTTIGLRRLELRWIMREGMEGDGEFEVGSG
jgi:hypothetical protein